MAKNLPAGTTADELKAMFSKHGDLGRLVLPPTGVTGKTKIYQNKKNIYQTSSCNIFCNFYFFVIAIVEFLDPSEARTAFTKLAYTKFKHLPLYLEWAPEDTFVTQKTSTKSKNNLSENMTKSDG